MSAVLPFSVALTLDTADPVQEGSACVVSAAFVNAEGAAFVPATIAYRVDDLDGGGVIVPAGTSVTPAEGVNVTVTAAQNALLSDTLACETHQMVVTATDGSGNEVNEPISWQVQRIFPSNTE